MTCPRCERANAAGRRYCGGCGAGLERACASCAFVNTVDDRYCGGCGEGLAIAAAGPRAAITPSRGGPAMIGADELRALLADLAPAVRPAVLPDGAITQDDLDRVFGGVS